MSRLASRVRGDAGRATLQERIQKLLRCTINGVNSLAQWARARRRHGTAELLAAMRAEYTVRGET